MVGCAAGTTRGFLRLARSDPRAFPASFIRAMCGCRRTEPIYPSMRPSEHAAGRQGRCRATYVHPHHPSVFRQNDEIRFLGIDLDRSGVGAFAQWVPPVRSDGGADQPIMSREDGLVTPRGKSLTTSCAVAARRFDPQVGAVLTGRHGTRLGSSERHFEDAPRHVGGRRGCTSRDGLRRVDRICTRIGPDQVAPGDDLGAHGRG